MTGARVYNLRPDLPDIRDWWTDAIDEIDAFSLPPKVDWRPDPRMPEVWNQLALGACTAHGIPAALVFHELARVMPSRLFLYFNERVIEGTVESDSGAQIRDGIKSVATQGICPEAEWPYDIAKFKQRPPSVCYADSKQDVALEYRRVRQTTADIRGQLAAGNLVVIGFSVYESFESQAVASTGIVPLPKRGEQLLGGHCVAAVGYDHPRRRFIMRNSWGTGWGQDGYFEMPYEYLTHPGLSSDFWTVSKVGALQAATLLPLAA